jgi:hypothetical protein
MAHSGKIWKACDSTSGSARELYGGISKLGRDMGPQEGDLLAYCHSILHGRTQPLVQVTELLASPKVRHTATHTAVY